MEIKDKLGCAMQRMEGSLGLLMMRSAASAESKSLSIRNDSPLGTSDINRHWVSSSLLLIIVVLASCLMACSEADRKWKEACDTNSVQAYDQFVRDFPNSDYTATAIGKRQELRWAQVTQDNTKSGYEQFLKEEAMSPHAADARKRLVKIEVMEIMASDDANEKVRRYVVLLGRSDYDAVALTGVKEQLDGVAAVEDVDPLVLANDEVVGRYVDAFPNTTLATRLATAKEVRSRAGTAADKIWRVNGVVQAISPKMISLTVKGSPTMDGLPTRLLPPGSKVAVGRQATSLMEYHISITSGESRTNSIGHAIVVKSAELPQVGDLTDIYIHPVVKDVGSARWIEPEIAGVWYRSRGVKPAAPSLPQVQGETHRN